MTTKRQFEAKSKQAMSRPDAKVEVVYGKRITSHVQNQLVERDIPANDFLRTLKKAEHKCPVKYRGGDPSYEQHGKRVTVCLTPDGKTVKTAYPLDYRDARKYHISYEPLSNMNKKDPEVQNKIKMAQPTVKGKSVQYQHTSTSDLKKILRRR